MENKILYHKKNIHPKERYRAKVEEVLFRVQRELFWHKSTPAGSDKHTIWKCGIQLILPPLISIWTDISQSASLTRL